jgi:hypothetical protein
MLRSGRIQTLLLLGIALLGRSAVLGADAPDLSTPKKAALTFAKALEDDDLAGIRSSCIGSDDDFKVIAEVAKVVNAGKKVREAAIARFGEAEAQKIIPTPGPPAGIGLPRQIEQSRQKIEVDTATLSGPQENAEPLRLRRIKGAWRVDLSALPDRNEMAQALPLLIAIRNALLNAADQIATGKYKSADEAREQLETMLEPVSRSRK